ncbi:hypothetical protein MPRF_11210 [Mycolicibacterium parafortuitum]|uniref:Uncharacterized protein n=1 Tax=Mycolicibacterium parafortuitum TaxID=39692 RepID=A0A7I7TYG2_MYCPF|nr:hypothetical protein [Mycolicibacterium parafortuitum]PQD98856.1 hypothetical protein CYL16_20935 [Mycobacterium sp. EPG1]BBY74222.1 hypothetical protein MPRF_11210 [Mycolicibacterium parafortuitum]
MVRGFAAMSATVAALGALSAAPAAAAAEPDQTVRILDGQIRCLISADWQGRGRPAAVCGRVDGQAFQATPKGMNLAVVLGTGAVYYIAGSVPGPESADIVLGAGQTDHVNGWTIRSEELRAIISYDIGGHGMRINPVEATSLWV